MAGSDLARVVAVVFGEREKDYGGVHVGVDASVLPKLRGMLVTLRRGAHSLTLAEPPGDFARGIVEGHSPRALRRLDFAAGEATRVTLSETSALVELSSVGAHAVSMALDSVAKREGDIVVAGDSDAWTDRLWFWPL
jgi:hypothetical protein